MRAFSSLAFTASVCASIVRCGAQPCPAVPGNFSFGVAIPMIPGDIPDGCSDYEILFARGTSEPNADNGGKFGVIVGDPIMRNVAAILPRVQGYPVQYPADDNFLENLENGGHDMADRVVSQSKKCPNQQFALVGYSQGAGIVHKATGLIPIELQSRVKSISTFGDPTNGQNAGDIWPSDWPTGLQDVVRDVCAEGDPICDTSGTCFYNHLTYSRPLYTDAAAQYIFDQFLDT